MLLDKTSANSMKNITGILGLGYQVAAEEKNCTIWIDNFIKKEKISNNMISIYLSSFTSKKNLPSMLIIGGYDKKYFKNK